MAECLASCFQVTLEGLGINSLQVLRHCLCILKPPSLFSGPPREKRDLLLPPSAPGIILESHASVITSIFCASRLPLTKHPLPLSIHTCTGFSYLKKSRKKCPSTPPSPTPAPHRDKLLQRSAHTPHPASSHLPLARNYSKKVNNNPAANDPPLVLPSPSTHLKFHQL